MENDELLDMIQDLQERLGREEVGIDAVTSSFNAAADWAPLSITSA